MIKTLEKNAKKYPILLDELAHAYLEGGLGDKAFKIIEKHLKKYPKNVTGLLVKALAHEDVGEAEEAERLYREIIDLEPNNIRAITRLASLEDDKSDASDYWKKMLAAVDPLCPWIQAVEVKGKKEESIDEMDTAKGWRESFEEEAVGASDATEGGESVSAEPVQEGDISLDEEIGLDDQFDERLLKDLEELEADEAAGEESTGREDEERLMEEETAIPDEIDLDDAILEEAELPDETALSDLTEDAIAEEDALIEESETLISADETETMVDVSESEELPPVEDNGDYSPSPAEMSELQKVYQEITDNSETKGTGSADRTKNLNTVTLARLYKEQGDFARALEVYQALPEETQTECQTEIDELRNYLNQKEE